MSRDITDNYKDVDSEEARAYRQSFIARMERKLEFKKSLNNPHYQEDRYLLR